MRFKVHQITDGGNCFLDFEIDDVQYHSGDFVLIKQENRTFARLQYIDVVDSNVYIHYQRFYLPIKSTSIGRQEQRRGYHGDQELVGSLPFCCMSLGIDLKMKPIEVTTASEFFSENKANGYYTREYYENSERIIFDTFDELPFENKVNELRSIERRRNRNIPIPKTVFSPKKKVGDDLNHYSPMSLKEKPRAPEFSTVRKSDERKVRPMRQKLGKLRLDKITTPSTTSAATSIVVDKSSTTHSTLTNPSPLRTSKMRPIHRDKMITVLPDMDEEGGFPYFEQFWKYCCINLLVAKKKLPETYYLGELSLHNAKLEYGVMRTVQEIHNLKEALINSFWKENASSDIESYPIIKTIKKVTTPTKTQRPKTSCDICHKASHSEIVYLGLFGPKYSTLTLQSGKFDSLIELFGKCDMVDVDRPEMRFEAGKHCAAKALLYHNLCHYIFNILKGLDDGMTKYGHYESVKDNTFSIVKDQFFSRKLYELEQLDREVSKFLKN
ncbi:hypothetical protein QTN25_008765 [Entamoeba marina]